MQKHNVYFSCSGSTITWGEKDKLLPKSQIYTSSSFSQICLAIWPYPLHTLAHPFVKEGLAYFPTSLDCSRLHSFCFIKFLQIMYSRCGKKKIMIVFVEYFSAEGLHLVCRLSFSH